MTVAERFSFEFFPPKTDPGRKKLRATYAQLNTLSPNFFSVTYGAGGSTRDNTKDTVIKMRKEGLAVAPHLSFGNDSEVSILSLINEYKTVGVDRLVALRGDSPSGTGAQHPVYASNLVKFIRKNTGDHFHLDVAAYPEIHPDAPNYDADIRFLKEKLDAGANSAITQYFFNADAYSYFLDRCAAMSINKPIYVGIMPIVNVKNLMRFSKNCGADIPRWLVHKLESYGDDQESIIAFGIDFVTRLCEKVLADRAPGLHFYTMNQAEPTITIWNNLKLSTRINKQ